MPAKPLDKEQIFNRAAELSGLAQRAAFLDHACGDDTRLRGEIEQLLRHDNDAGSFLEQPLSAYVATIAGSPFDTVDEATGGISLEFLQPSDKPGCLGTLDQYGVVEVVGRGGMGLVLRAHDSKLNRVVAIKVMAPELAANAMAVKRFLREAQAAAAVSHDHVVTIHAIHDVHRPPFIVMEFVNGQSLQEKIDRRGALELVEILRIGMQTAAGLAAAHKQGLVHRDIKPANMLLENGVERVKLTDFGLARAVDDVSVTQTGQIAGTPQYMSPEQALGHAVDARSDLFSLGSVLYTMCTGRPPFRAETAIAVLRRVCDDDPLEPEMILWDANTGEQVRRFVGHQQTVRRVAISPDGRFALSGSDDKTMRMWNIETGEQVRSFGGHDETVYCVAFSSDGKRAAYGSGYHTGVSGGEVIRLWNVETGEELGFLEGHQFAVLSVQFSADGRRILSGSADRTVRLWDVDSRKEIRRFDGTVTDIHDAVFSPDERFVFAGALASIESVKQGTIDDPDNGQIWMWETKSGQVVRTADEARDSDAALPGIFGRAG